MAFISQFEACFTWLNLKREEVRVKMLLLIPLTRTEQQSPVLVLGIKEADVFTVVIVEWLSHRVPSYKTKDASLFYEHISIHQADF